MTDKVMLVVGGSRGIGAAIAEQAARAGYAVALSYVSREPAAQSVVARIAQAGGTARAVRADTASEDDIVALFDAAATLGRLNALIYSTGVTGTPSLLADASAETLHRVIAVNLTGAMLCARESVRRMGRSRGGHGGSITLISSRAADLGSAGEHVWYAASKGGMNSLAIGLAKEAAPEGIRVNCVSPGPVSTDMLSPERQAIGAARVPMQRVARPEEIAEAALFLASDRASYVNGANLAVSGGA